MICTDEIPKQNRKCGLCCTKIENFGVIRGRTDVTTQVNWR
jgi:hypothetical protein